MSTIIDETAKVFARLPQTVLSSLVIQTLISPTYCDCITMASGASPSIAYRPLDQSGLGPDNDDEDDGRRWKFSIRLIALWRLLMAGLAFADIIVWASLGLLDPFIAAFVLLFVVIAWSLLLVLPWSRFTRAVPTILCQIGDWTCLLNGEDRPGGPFRKPMSPGQKRMKLALIAVVDLALGLTIIIITGGLAKSKEIPHPPALTQLTSSCLKRLLGTAPGIIPSLDTSPSSPSTSWSGMTLPSSTFYPHSPTLIGCLTVSWRLSLP